MAGVSIEQRRDRLAQLLVGFGANVQPGQITIVSGTIEDRELMRAIVAHCYRAGALYVEAEYLDPYVKRARVLYGGDDSIGYAPDWEVSRVRAVAEQRCANIHLVGGTDPTVLGGLDPDRIGRDRPPTGKEWMKAITDRSVNWTIGPSPTPIWAAVAHPELPGEQGLATLWDEIERVCRLDEEDPVSAWMSRMDALVAVAGRLTDRRLDMLHFEGPGTDLKVGLLPSSCFRSGGLSTVGGIEHRPNVPSEEVFTTPDPERVEGSVRATKPLDLGGTVISGLRVRFEGGRAVEIDADQGADTLRSRTAIDGGTRLGEVALVDRDSRIGRLNTVFYETLLDENAASHIALGAGLDFGVTDDADIERINRSEVHIDFMIGSDDVSVTGITATGERVPVLAGGEWQV